MNVDPTHSLGTPATIKLEQGSVRYWDIGAGRPVVFVHGLFVNAALWRNVAPGVAAAGHRCIVVDWPFGGHELPLNPDTALDPPAVADLIADLIVALELEDVTLVANDTGGAFSQLVVVNRPERISSLVLTPSDSLERFFPPMFRYLQLVSKLPGSTFLVAQSLRLRWLHRLPMVLGLLSKRPLPRAVVDWYLRPMQRSSAIRRDLGKILRGVDNHHTLAAAEHFADVKIPVLLAWAREDRLFTWDLANRLEGLLPNAELIGIDDSYTFVSEDCPTVLTEILINFLSRLPSDGH